MTEAAAHDADDDADALELTRQLARSARQLLREHTSNVATDRRREGLVRGYWTVDSTRHPEIRNFRDTYMTIVLRH